MRNKQIQDLVFAAIISAIIIVLTATMWGFINIGGFAFITIIHIPVLIGAIVLGKKYGMFFGFIFGLSSLILSAILLGTNAPFTNPLLSLLPRILFGFIIYPIYKYFSKVIKKPVLSTGIAIAVSTIIHSVIVTVLLYFVANSGFYFTASENPLTINENFFIFIIGLFSLNSLIEIVLAVIIGVPTIMVLNEIRNNEFEESL